MEYWSGGVLIYTKRCETPLIHPSINPLGKITMPEYLMIFSIVANH